MPGEDSTPERQSSSSSTPSPTVLPEKTARKPEWTDWWNAAKTIRPEDYRNIERVPCMKQSLMYGIAGGSVIGCTRYLSSNPFVASNWAVASFVLIAAASWRRCRSIQAAQKEQIQVIRDQLVGKARRKQGQTPTLPPSTAAPVEGRS